VALVAVLGRRSAEGEETVRRVREAGGEAIYCQADVTKEEDVTAALRATLNKFGKLDILMNNAGGASPQEVNIADTSEEIFWSVIKVNLYATWLGCKLAMPHLIRNGGGSIINTISTVGLMGVANLGSYGSAKGGVVGLTNVLAVECAPHKIRVNCVAPGFTKTERIAKSSFVTDHSDVAKAHLLGFAEPVEIAQAALYLASDEARVTTGLVLKVDSGVTIS
jgi:NAD(P)-dependent dehydrogenase (short-subunit alcohol dehydrogenase family)